MGSSPPPGGVCYGAALATGCPQVTHLLVATIARWWMGG